MRRSKESSFYKMEGARKCVSLPLSTNRGYALMEGTRELAEACLAVSSRLQAFMFICIAINKE